MTEAVKKLRRMGKATFRWIGSMDDEFANFAHRGAAGVHRAFSAARLAPSPRILPLASIADDDVVTVRARILAPPLRGGAHPRSIRGALLRQVSPALRDVNAEVTWEGATQSVRSDEWGYLSATFATREPPPPLTWATLHCRHPDHGSADGIRAPVYGPPRGAHYVVVSDIDDTIIETELENPARRLAQLLGISLRLPFEGIVELFQDFARAGNPICYLSNSSWRLQEPLAALFSEHGLPPGPLLLRQRGREGSSGRGESSAVTHKRDALLHLANRFSELPFVLVGDSSREDPLRYIELAKAHPGRVLAIYIRSVAGSLARITDLPALERQAAQLGVPFVVSERSADMRAHAVKNGFIDSSEEQAA